MSIDNWLNMGYYNGVLFGHLIYLSGTLKGVKL